MPAGLHGVQNGLHWTLTKQEKAVVLALASHLNEKKPDAGAWPSQKTLQAMTGWSERSVQNAIKSAREKGIIRKKTHKRVSGKWLPVYTVHPERGSIHKHFIEDDTQPPDDCDDEEDAPVADCPASDTASPADGAPSTRTECTQTTPYQEVISKGNNGAALTRFRKKEKTLGEMTEEEFMEAKKYLRAIVIERCGTCEPLNHPIWEKLREKYRDWYA